jgi:hypothetical protein
MINRFTLAQLRLLPVFGRWLLLASLIGVLGGLASALLIVALDWATNTRTAHPWLLWLLPVAGLAVGSFYHRARPIGRGREQSPDRRDPRSEARGAQAHGAVDPDHDDDHAPLRRLGRA